MIRAATGQPRPSINPMRGEFAASIAGEVRHFDTRLSTIDAIEAACGDRAIVEVLNGIIVGRRARDVIPLLAAAIAAADTPPDSPDALAARATVGEAEAFVLALIFALGFQVGARDTEEQGRTSPLDDTRSGTTGAPSRSAP